MLFLPRPRSCHAPLTAKALRARPGPRSPARARIADVRHSCTRRGQAMASKPPKGDPVQDAPQVAEPKHAAAGIPAIGHSLRIAQQQMGVRRTALTLLRVNQKDGFDCPGCAWPEPEHRHTAEFCENGAKAVAEEATLRRVTPDFFAAHPVSDLATRSGYWLGQ